MENNTKKSKHTRKAFSGSMAQMEQSGNLHNTASSKSSIQNAGAAADQSQRDKSQNPEVVSTPGDQRLVEDVMTHQVAASKRYDDLHVYW